MEFREELREGIASRAYEIYVQRGGENGQDVEDWLKAEKEISGKTADVPAKARAAAAGSGSTNRLR
jgi:Protein of unknown function (DUF2934)